MPIATVTSKGQITIPIEVREHLGLAAGSQVQFLPAADGTYEISVKTRSIREMAGMLRYDGPPVTVDEMDAAIADAAIERYQRSR